MLSNLTSCGANDPASYTTRMRAAEMVGLRSSAFRLFEEQYSGIQELRSAFHKQLALDAKIEKVAVSGRSSSACLLVCGLIPHVCCALYLCRPT